MSPILSKLIVNSIIAVIIVVIAYAIVYTLSSIFFDPRASMTTAIIKPTSVDSIFEKPIQLYQYKYRYKIDILESEWSPGYVNDFYSDQFLNINQKYPVEMLVYQSSSWLQKIFVPTLWESFDYRMCRSYHDRTPFTNMDLQKIENQRLLQIADSLDSFLERCKEL